MPEFHKNQVRWDAPEAQKVTLAKPDYSYLQGALDNLSRAGDAIADTERQMLDDRLKSDLDEQLTLANQDIEDARSVTADFDSLGEKALSRIQGTLGQYDEATQRRFLNANPHYLDNTQLAIQEKILKRKRDIFETDVENNLPLWTSQAMIAGTKEARQDVIHKIQESLGNISYETTVDNLIFKANQMMDNTNIANLISAGTEESLKAAEAFLRSPETSVTIDAYKRSGWFGQISDAYARLEREKAKSAKEDPTASMLLDSYIQLKRTGNSAAADDLYRLVVNTDEPIVKTSPAGWGLDVNGKAIPQYFDLSKLSATQRADLGLEMNKYKKLDPHEAYKESEYRVAVNDALTNMQIAAENKTSDQASIVSNIEVLMSDPEMFAVLPDGTQDKLVETRDKYLKAGAEALRGHKTFVDTVPFAARSIGVPVEEMGVLISHMKSPEVRVAAGASQYLQNLSAQELFRGPNGEYVTREQVAGWLEGQSWRKTPRVVDAANDMVVNFFSDTDPNSIGRFGVNLVTVLEAFKNSGKLNNTRLDGSDEHYFDTLSKWMTIMRNTGKINARMQDANDADADLLLSMIVNDDLTADEKAIAADMKRWTKTSQAPRNAGALTTALSTPSAQSTYKPSGSHPTPNIELYKIMNSLNKKEGVDKAYKAATKD